MSFAALPLRVMRDSHAPADTQKAWYFEIAELLRKLILCGATGFIAPGTLTQIVFCLVFCTVCT